MSYKDKAEIVKLEALLKRKKQQQKIKQLKAEIACMDEPDDEEEDVMPITMQNKRVRLLENECQFYLLRHTF
jgi:hypothetical protein